MSLYFYASRKFIQDASTTKQVQVGALIEHQSL